jgi:hypothetical protein
VNYRLNEKCKRCIFDEESDKTSIYWKTFARRFYDRLSAPGIIFTRQVKKRRLTMKTDYQKGKILAKGKNVYIGIDVHKEKWHVTAQVAGEEVFNGCSP